jgi:tetratricopeptide (TPR) repeat protein
MFHDEFLRGFKKMNAKKIEVKKSAEKKLNVAKKTAFSALMILCIQLSFAQTKPDALKLYREGNYKESIAVCEEEITSNPSNLDSHVVLCWALVANRQYKEAEQRATEARKLNSYDIRLIEVLGEAKYYLGKNNEALSMFQRYVANSSETAARLGTVYYYMGEIYIRQAKYEHADIAFTAAVRFEPTYSANWWTRLGYAREMTNDWKNALTAYDKALSLSPAHYDASRGKTRCQSHI